MGELSDLGGLTIMCKLGQIAEKCQEIQASTGMLRVYYQDILTVCDQTLTVASTAEADYDVIFNGLEEIFNDPGNQTLQDRVDTTIKCRLDNITLLAHAAQGTTDGMKEGTFQTIDYQLTLRTLSDELSSSAIQNKLRGILYSEEELQHDLGGFVKIQNFLAGQNMKNQPAASISNLETLLGAVSAISSDLGSLRESIQESAQPGPELLLDMDKAVLLQDPQLTTLTLPSSDDMLDAETAGPSQNRQALLLLVRSAANISEQLTATIEVVNRHFMRSLGLTERMESAKSLSVYGLDPLAAVDFCNWLRQELKVTITTLDVSSAKTLSALSTTTTSTSDLPGTIKFLAIDLSDLRTVKPFVTAFFSQESRLDIL
ncbi:hypothetical protein COH21_012669 [Aspergillus flavus]|nr:hypothetical protein COH21_012669 [Aspergillus flavus]